MVVKWLVNVEKEMEFLASLNAIDSSYIFKNIIAAKTIKSEQHCQ